MEWKDDKLIVEQGEEIRIFDKDGFKVGTFELKSGIEIPSDVLRKSEELEISSP